MVIQFTYAGRAGDIDLGEVVADHVQPHEQQTLVAHIGADFGGNGTVGVGQRPAHAAPAGGQIASEFAFGGHPCQCVVHRFAVDQQDALVAIGDRWQIGLGQGVARAVLGEYFQHHAGIAVAGLDAKDARAAHAVERLDHHIAMLGDETLEVGGAARHQRRPGQMREAIDRHLLVDIPKRVAAIDHQRTFALRQFQNIRGVDVFHVEGWIDAHQDRIQIRQGDDRRFAGVGKPVVVIVEHLQPACIAVGHAVAHEQIRHLEIVDLVAAALRLQQ